MGGLLSVLDPRGNADQSTCSASRKEGGDQPSAEAPLFSFGVVADIQHADKDNALASSDPSRVKRYRESPQKLASAIGRFNNQTPPLSFVLTLGDIIDGNAMEDMTLKDFQVVLEHLKTIQVPRVYHAIGNHCLSLPRSVILSGLGLSSSYYDVAPHPGWRLIVLDSMDLSLAWTSDSPKLKETADFLSQHPLYSESEPQMQEWNGGIGQEQLQWLAGKLDSAREAGEKVILALHHPVSPGSAPSTLLLWNYNDLLECLSAHPSVVLVLCGHHHPGGYNEEKGIHFVTMESILEAPSKSEAYGIAHVFKDHIKIEGHGVVSSRRLDF